MTPRVSATIALRIIAMLILIWVIYDLTKLVLLIPGGHSSPHASNPIIAPSFDRTPSASTAFAFLWLAVPFVVVRFIGGLLLFFLSKPLGKLLARGLE